MAASKLALSLESRLRPRQSPKIMPMDDDVVDWGDGEDDEQPQDTAESQGGGGEEADAISLASDGEGDDLEALKKYHDQTWNDSSSAREAQAPVQAMEPLVEPSIPVAAPPSVPKETQETNIDRSGMTTPLNIPGLPPKPVSPVFTRGPPSTVSMSATAMSSRDARPNGNRKSPDEREHATTRLPTGWETRKSRKGETYYFNAVAGTTQWDYPTTPAKSSSRSRADSHEETTRRDRDNVGHTREAPRNTRRSRSREIKVIRRSPSPRAPIHRPRSRSLDRSYRSARAPSPRREPIRSSKETSHVRRNSPPARERELSPRPLGRSDTRARSPGPSREDNDSYRRDRRQEPLQSSRHRSPPPRNRSQDRSTHRSTRDHMDIDHYEPPSHNAVRRRRSLDAMDTGESKRRRLDTSPPPRGIDRYVPDHSKSNRMDLDLPKPRQDIKRPTVTDNHASREKSHRDPPPHMQSKDRNEVSERDVAPSRSMPRGQSPAARDRESHPSVTQRSKVPLPPQSAVMRMGHSDRPRQTPMEVDNTRVTGISRDPAPTGPKADRGRSFKEPARVEPSHGRSQRDERGPPPRPEAPNRGDSIQDRARRPDQGPGPSRDQVNGFHSDNGWQKPHGRVDGPGDARRGRGRGSRLASSNVNDIPLSQPRGRFGQATTAEEVIPQRPVEAEQEVERSIESLSEQQPEDSSIPKKSRQSRFGPPTETVIVAVQEQPLSNNDLEQPKEDHDRSIELGEIVDDEKPPSEEQGKVDIPTPAPVGTYDNREGQLQRDPLPRPPHYDPQSDRPPQGTHNHNRREDGVRINRERVFNPDLPRRPSIYHHVDAAPPTSTHLPYDEGSVVPDYTDGKYAPSPVNDRQGMQLDSELSSYQSGKPQIMRQGSLLERLGGSLNGQGDDSYDYAGGERGGERGRGRRGKRSGRVHRR